MEIFKRTRQFDQMMTDPAFPFQVGRLIGIAEVSGHLLKSQETPDVQMIGDSLLRSVLWFLDVRMEPPTEQVTQVLPPAKGRGEMPREHKL